MQYTGPESNRCSKTSEFLLGTKFHIRDLVENAQEGEDITILEIGCGREQKFLKEISKDIEIQKANANGKNIELFSVSAEEANCDDILHFTQFLNARDGLKFLPPNLKFDYIFSSWCFNYFDPETFNKVLRDSLNRLKVGGQIEIFPFQATRNSPEFPCGLNLNNYFKNLFYSKNPNNELIKMEINRLSQLIGLKVDTSYLEEDIYKLQTFFQENFLNDDILSLADNKANSAGKKIQRQREFRLYSAICDREKYQLNKLKINEDDCISILKKS